MRLVALLVLLTAASACTGGDPDAKARPAPTSVSPDRQQVTSWRSAANKVEADLSDSVRKIDPRLRGQRAIDIAVHTCVLLGGYQSDAVLLRGVRSEIETETGSRLTDEEAASFALLANELVCPGLAR